MIDFLLDTNVIIYAYSEHPTYLHFLRTVAGKTLGMSMITYIEILVGARSDIEERELENFLDNFRLVPITSPIAKEIARWIRRKKQKGLRHPGVSDTIIGQTALSQNVPLVTNNPKDFSAFKSLKLIIPE